MKALTTETIDKLALLSRHDVESSLGPDERNIEMFHTISPTYDLLNHLLSLGLDISWRRRCAKALDISPGCEILDCAAGTGDMAIAVCREVPDARVVLLDPAKSMLARAETKLADFPQSTLQFVHASAEPLPFASESFDRVMVGFGIRNFRQLDVGLAELFRVTRRGGKGVILEFTPDRPSIFQPFFKFYLSQVVKRVGSLISGDGRAYDYLRISIRDFPTTAELAERLTRIGWTVAGTEKLSGGVATLFILRK